MLHSLAGATIVTPDVDRAIAAYRDFLGYTGTASGTVTPEQAAAWGASAAAGARTAMLYPERGDRRFVRLVEGRAHPDFAPLATLGWTALELVVQDLHALAERLVDSPFRIVGPPAVLDFDFTDALSAMQVVGPGGELLYLTQIDGEIPGFDLPRAESAVGQMFVAVLAAADLDRTGAFYAEAGRPAGPIFEARIDFLTDAYALPAGHRHALTTVALAARTLIEIDAFPRAARPRGLSDIGLPSGIAMVGVHAGATARTGMLRGATDEWIELLPA